MCAGDGCAGVGRDGKLMLRNFSDQQSQLTILMLLYRF